MFHNLQLSDTFSADRQIRFRSAATRQRLVRRNKAPTAAPPGAILTVIWPDDPEFVTVPDRARCVA